MNIKKSDKDKVLSVRQFMCGRRILKMLILLVLSLGVMADALGAPRISGGTGAALGQFPHVVLVVARSKSINFCSGSILTDSWVLTCAHCVLVPGMEPPIPPEDFKLYTGVLSLSTHPLPKSFQKVRGKNFVIHPGYQLFNATNYTDVGSYNDLALIETATPFLLNEMVKTIPLAMVPSPRGLVRCEVAGFGFTESISSSLNYMTIRVIETCSVVDHEELNHLYRSNEYLCGFSQTKSHTRPGDSGAPLQCGGFLVGVNFWVKPLHTDNYIMIIIDVFPFLDWIRSHVPHLSADYLNK